MPPALRCNHDRHRRPALEPYATEHTTAPPDYLEELATDLRATLEFPGMMVGPARGPVPRDADLRPRCHGRCSRSGPSAGTRPWPWPPAWPRAAGSSAARSPRSMPSSPAGTSPPAPTPTASRWWWDRPSTPSPPSTGRSTWSSSTPTRRPTPTTSRRCCPSWRPAGLIAADNTLWSGRILDPDRHQRRHRGPPDVQRRAGRRPPGGGGPDHRPRRGHPHPAGRLAGRARPCWTTTSTSGPTPRATPRPPSNRWPPTASGPPKPG